ncbi:F0F1 ATP synthase subunit epsilon [Blattabacterium cuenoti]|uniref:F0F1 ATP synthase subunit epsilon n=1 Tax=Blattabacterium cuenoti TaxID=1653831 RepID=UPI00163CF70F|nr:F0F1 ATP synthase subunit epsilon [Blattabacterium cuenoti]
MKIKIFKLQNIEYKGEVISIYAPGIDGYFQILDNHTSFISILKSGILKFYFYEKNKKIIKKMKIKNGIFQVKENDVLIFI